MEGSLSRRNALKSLASASALGLSAGLGLAKPARPASGPPYVFNVLIQGLWAIIVWQDQLELLAPIVRGLAKHVYQVGTLDKDASGNLTVNAIPIDPGSYHVNVSRNGAPANFPSNDFAIATATNDFDWSLVACRVLLPLPTYARALFRVSDGSNAILTGTSLTNVPAKIPLTILLGYDTSDASVSVGYGSPKPVWSSNLGSQVNLHFWAEPPKEPDLGHSLQAFATLQAMLPSEDIALNPSVSPCLMTDSTVPPELNIPECEAYPLSAQLNGCSLPPCHAQDATAGVHVFSTRPANCMSLIIPNYS
jgi:hypothetical protein